MEGMKKLLITATNDLFTDQRLIRMGKSLHDMGFRIFYFGLMRPDSMVFDPPFAAVKRYTPIFQKGFLFYAEYNIRLFFFILFKSFDLLVANDLDSLPASQLGAWIRNKPLVHDAHEYFTGTPEVMSRPGVYRVWKALERFLLPRQKKLITVNESIAQLFHQEYGLQATVIRNLPPHRKTMGVPDRNALGLPVDKKLVLLQGSGINKDRGAEEMLAAMHPDHGLDHVVFVLIGGGTRFEHLRGEAHRLGVQDKVLFFGRMPYERLFHYTANADIGLSLDKGVSPNNTYSLPNKLFDYIMAGTPVLASRLPEVVRIIRDYEVGAFIDRHEPAHLASKIREMLNNPQAMQQWQTNCLKAARELCWEKEAEKLIPVYNSYLPGIDSGK